MYQQPNKPMQPAGPKRPAADRQRRWSDLVTAFLDLKLHDATLVDVSVSWATQEVLAEVDACYVGGDGPPRMRLRWSGCSRVVIPHEAPWGRSVSINSHGYDGARFWIEMQSGETIEVWASQFDLV